MASLNGSNTFIVHNSPLGPGPKTKRWGQAPRSNFSAGVRPQSKVFNIAAATFFVMKGVAAARFWYRSRVVNFSLGSGPKVKF